MNGLFDKKQPSEQVLNVIKKLAPGTALRNGIELILSGKTGALLVIGDHENVEKICDGGFEVSAHFSSNNIAELAKMDGAIILDEALKRILKVNVHLMPDPLLPTSETGTRHRTAERVSKQTEALVIAISESRDLVSIYYKGEKYVLDDTRTLLSKANQALQTLERYKYRFDQEAERLTALEFQELSTLTEVITVIQRAEMLVRVAEEIERYITQLGAEGRLIKLQLEELMAGVEDEYLMVIYDYRKDKRSPKEVKKKISSLTPEELLDMLRISKFLGYPSDGEVLDEIVVPRGYRAIKKVPKIPLSVIDNIVEKYGDLKSVLKATSDDLDKVEGVGEVRANSIFEGLQRLRETSSSSEYSSL